MDCNCRGGALFIGSTPVHFYYFPISPYELDKVYITYAQDGRIVLEKTLEDLEFCDECTSKPYAAKLKLSQEDTYKFDGRKRKYCMQVKAKTHFGEVFESPIRYYNVEPTLNREVI